jgi:hypothetical protein
MFLALLSRPQEALHKRHLVYSVRTRAIYHLLCTYKLRNITVSGKQRYITCRPIGKFLFLVWQYCRRPWSFTYEPCSFGSGRIGFFLVRRVWNGSTNPKSRQILGAFRMTYSVLPVQTLVIIEDSQCTYDLILRRAGSTISRHAEEWVSKLWVSFVFEFDYLACILCRFFTASYCHPWSLWLSNLFFRIIPRLPKKSYWAYKFWFSLQILSETFLILRRIQRDTQACI